MKITVTGEKTYSSRNYAWEKNHANGILQGNLNTVFFENGDVEFVLSKDVEIFFREEKKEYSVFIPVEVLKEIIENQKEWIK